MTHSESSSPASEWDRLIARLDKAGVPPDQKWRTLVLYIRNMATFTFLTEKQKSQLQNLIVETLQEKDYSEDRYLHILRRQEEILLGPHTEKMQMALDETKALIEDVRSLLMRKKGDVQELESTTVDLVEQEIDSKELISSMRKAFHEVVEDMEQDMEDLTRLSNTDQLTQLNNRRAFDEILAVSVEASLETGEPLSLVMMDIDHFKRFNDDYGHQVGDQALKLVGKTLQACGELFGRGNNTCYHACRYGGEEFAVILPHTGAEVAAEVAEDIRSRIGTCCFNIQNKKGKIVHQGLKISISLGVQQLDPNWPGAHVANLIEFADRKLYQAKECGRDQVCSELDVSST